MRAHTLTCGIVTLDARMHSLTHSLALHCITGPGPSGAAPSSASASASNQPLPAPRAAGRPANSRILKLVPSGAIVPHKDKVEKGGEDAFFVTSAGCGAVGVADGVGGWSEDGVDPALYARTLMVRCCEALDSTAGGEAVQV